MTRSLVQALEQSEPEPRPVRLFFQDESRLGLRLPSARRLCASGVKPIQPHAPLYQYYWLYAAVEPTTGESYWWELPRLNSHCFELFLQQMSQHYANSLNIIVVDNAPAHTAKTLTLPDNILIVVVAALQPRAQSR